MIVSFSPCPNSSPNPYLGANTMQPFACTKLQSAYGCMAGCWETFSFNRACFSSPVYTLFRIKWGSETGHQRKNCDWWAWAINYMCKHWDLYIRTVHAYISTKSQAICRIDSQVFEVNLKLSSTVVPVSSQIPTYMLPANWTLYIEQ